MKTALNASSRIMYETALTMGITCSVFADQETILMQKDGKQWYTRGSRTSFQSSIGKSIADNKSLTKVFLDHFGLPTAKSIRVENIAELSQLDSLQMPVVMKPIDGRHGQGVVVGLKDTSAAKSAYRPELGTVIFEETLQGEEYRIVCVDFKFVAAAYRKPAHVTGDGIHTIQELVAQKNQHPWRGEGHQANLTLIKIDEVVQQNLADAGFNSESIPKSGQEVLLRKTANLSTGGEAWNVSYQVSDDNIALFEKIARACDLNVVGIDIMCPSLHEPIATTPRAGVIEVNASPGLRMHHYPIQGESINVAEKILTMALKAQQI